MFQPKSPHGLAQIFLAHAAGCAHDKAEDVDGKLICSSCGEQLAPAPDPVDDAELEQLFDEGAQS